MNGHAVDVTAWGGVMEQFRDLRGKYLAVFDLEVRSQARGKCQVETSWNARVEVLEDMDQAMITFRDTLTKGTCAQTFNMVTSKWAPNESTFDVKGPQHLLCTCFSQTHREEC